MKGLLLFDISETGDTDWSSQIQKTAGELADISSFQELEELIRKSGDRKTKQFYIHDKLLKTGEKDSITVFINGIGYEIICKEILYAESDKRKVKIITEEKKYEVYMKMDQLEKQLPEYFLRIHKSYLVNMDRIDRFSTENVILKNGIRISVSRARYKEAREKFKNYTQP